VSNTAAIDTELWWEEVVGDLVEILLELGEASCARRTLDFYCNTQRARRWQVGMPVEQRCRALLSAADGDLPGALSRLDAAVSGLDADAWSVDLGRILLARGSLLRVLGRTWEARSDLKRAVAIFTRDRHTSWHAAALRALVGTVAPEPNPWVPTQPARMVATLTGGFWTDQEIAARLRVSLVAVQQEMGTPAPPSLGLPAAGSL
jgi:hypothetical protein